MAKRKERFTQTDLYISQRLKAARKASGLSQESAASLSGVSFQQVQKYENGANRVSAGRLLQLCKCYGISVAEIFKGIDALGCTNDDLGAALISSQYGAALARAFIKISDATNRRIVVDLAQALAA